MGTSVLFKTRTSSTPMTSTQLIFCVLVFATVIGSSFGLWENYYDTISNSFDNPSCQLRLYAVRQFLRQNDILEHDVQENDIMTSLFVLSEIAVGRYITGKISVEDIG